MAPNGKPTVFFEAKRMAPAIFTLQISFVPFRKKKKNHAKTFESVSRLHPILLNSTDQITISLPYTNMQPLYKHQQNVQFVKTQKKLASYEIASFVFFPPYVKLINKARKKESTFRELRRIKAFSLCPL